MQLRAIRFDVRWLLRRRAATDWVYIAVVGVLGAALIGRTGQIILSIRRAPAVSTAGETAAVVLTARSAASRASSDLALLRSAHLFGAPADVTEAGAAPTQSHWAVSGIIAGPTPESGFAMIGESLASIQLRTVGQDVGRAFKLVEVLSDRVTIEGSGRRFSLRLPRERGGAAAGNAVIADAGGHTELARAGSGPAIWHPPEGEYSAQSPAQALLQPEPHRDAAGHFHGIEVRGEDSDGALSRLGLQRNDVITKVNGRPISNASIAQTALLQMSGGSPVAVTVERDGGLQVLSIAMPQDGS